jgi:hypothetical protein
MRRLSVKTAPYIQKSDKGTRGTIMVIILSLSLSTKNFCDLFFSHFSFREEPPFFHLRTKKNKNKKKSEGRREQAVTAIVKSEHATWFT